MWVIRGVPGAVSPNIAWKRTVYSVPDIPAVAVEYETSQPSITQHHIVMKVHLHVVYLVDTI